MDPLECLQDARENNQLDGATIKGKIAVRPAKDRDERKFITRAVRVGATEKPAVGRSISSTRKMHSFDRSGGCVGKPLESRQIADGELIRREGNAGSRKGALQGFALAFMAGGIAGIAEWVVALPLDTIKTRVQSGKVSSGGGFFAACEEIFTSQVSFGWTWKKLDFFVLIMEDTDKPPSEFNYTGFPRIL